MLIFILAERLYVKNYADTYDLWLDNCQSYSILLAIALARTEEGNQIRDELQIKSTFWLNVVASILISLFWYWNEVAVRDLREFAKWGIRERGPDSFFATIDKQLQRLNHVQEKLTVFYLNPEVAFARATFLQRIGQEDNLQR